MHLCTLLVIGHLLLPFYCVPRATPESPATHGNTKAAVYVPGASTEHRWDIDGTTEHRRGIGGSGTLTEHRITYGRAPPRTRGGGGAPAAPERPQRHRHPKPNGKVNFMCSAECPSPPSAESASTLADVIMCRLCAASGLIGGGKGGNGNKA